ncbi:MAG: chorismate mutase [Clostridia bacterium]|nr:chorismate mutase [Clostridia bacterium]
MDIQELRTKIDAVDEQLVKLYIERMNLAGEVAEYKKANNMKIFDSKRERQLLDKVTTQAGEEHEDSTRILFSMLMELSRSYQSKLLSGTSKLATDMTNALENTPKLFPSKVTVACQGVEGAYSQLAADKLFSLPNIMYFSNFEAIFQAIDKGLCKYGVLPLENSNAGSVNKIYDLMIKYNFHIVRSTRVMAGHSLLAKPGTKISDIKEIFSHEQAIQQCESFLKDLNVKVTPVENTAIAAETVANSERTDVAAISSKACEKLYNLVSLSDRVQDNGNNYTRFICISKDLEIYPGADRTSLMAVIPHKPGSLYRLISRFYSLGINLVKLESRPIPDSDFEFMFYFDLDTSVYSPKLIQLISDLENELDDFRYLGSYSEVI